MNASNAFPSCSFHFRIPPSGLKLTPQDTRVAIETTSKPSNIRSRESPPNSPYLASVSKASILDFSVRIATSCRERERERKEGRKQRACEGGYSPFATESKFSSWYTYSSSYWRDPFSLSLSLSLFPFLFCSRHATRILEQFFDEGVNSSILVSPFLSSCLGCLFSFSSTFSSSRLHLICYRYNEHTTWRKVESFF